VRHLRIQQLSICFLISVVAVVFLVTRSSKVEAHTLLPLKANDPLPANRFVELAKAINPAVVNISSTQRPRRPRGRHFPNHPADPFLELFQQFMDPDSFYFQQQRPRQSLGTGFIIEKNGLIITNNHVINKADVIEVQLEEKSKKAYKATVVGKDPRTDIALIKIEVGKDLPVVPLGSSKDLQVGEQVAAFGNPLGFGHTMTRGIISAKDRQIDELNRFPLLQTDASINPGNSGGPLVNMQGKAIGVNNAIARGQGIGFAIPSDDVKRIVIELKEKGYIEHGYIGVAMQGLDKDTAQTLGIPLTKGGALIIQVVPKSPAEKGGIQPYDLVTEFGGKKVDSTRDLIHMVRDSSPGKKVKIKVVRGTQEKTLTLKVGQHPDDIGPQVQEQSGLKHYKGQKAPFGLGFRVSDYSKRLAKEMGLPQLRKKHPVVIEVSRGSAAFKAGLEPGDIILDVNRKVVYRSRDVLKSLSKDGINMMRVLKQNRVALLSLKSQK